MTVPADAAPAAAAAATAAPGSCMSGACLPAAEHDAQSVRTSYGASGIPGTESFQEAD